MKTLLLLLLVSLANIGFAQEDDYINYTQGKEKYHQFEDGEERYLLADNVNIRAEASSKAEIVTNLPIGTGIKIIEKSDNRLRLNGFKTNWYKVSFDSNEGKKMGYVWGGLIAEGGIQSVNSKVLFLYGIASVKKEMRGEYVMEKGVIQLRACKNKEELSRIELKAAGNQLNLFHWLANYGNKGLANVKDIIEYGESADMCGGVNAYNLIFWDGKKLMYAATRHPFGDAPYYSRDNLIFPSEKGGVKGKIINDKEEGWYDEKKEANVVQSRKKVEYIWTGEKLKQTKVLIDKEYDVKGY
jgi:hypothetical protein